MNIINVGVIGYGYWGPNFVRNFIALPEVKVIAVCDSRIDCLNKVLADYPHLSVTTEFQTLLQNPKIDAIAIATPYSTHFPLALAALKAGKHVLVSKPLATSSAQALQLLEEADRRELILMVDHTFIYSGAVSKIRELILNQELGEIQYYDSVRINLGLFQHDTNVLWDLAVHDLAIIDYVLPKKPVAVSCVAMSHTSFEHENIGYLTLLFDTNLIAHVHVNWLAPVKIRQTLISGDRKMIVYDDLETQSKVKIYDRIIIMGKNLKNGDKTMVNSRREEILIPELDLTEPLYKELKHFTDCIKNKKSPITDAKKALRVISILEAANKSLREEGKLIKLR